MSYWLPHIAVDVDQLLRFFVVVADAVVLLLCVVVVVVRARNSCAFFQIDQNKMLPNAIRCSGSERASAYDCVCVCINCIFGQCNVLDLHIYALCITIFLRERERATFVCIAHSLAHILHSYAHTRVCMCVCLICIQSEFQLTFEFCTFCNAYVMLTAAERTLSITMRALSFLSLSLCIVVQCR